MTEPVRFEIDVETLAVEGMTGPEAAALVAAAERALDARLSGRGGATGDPLAARLAERLAAALGDGRGRAG